jgi:hypothetical protein
VATLDWKKIDEANAWCAGFDQYPHRHQCPFDVATAAHAHTAYWAGWNQAALEAEGADAAQAA